MRLDVKAFSFAVGLLWGSWVMINTWWIILFDGTREGPVWLSHIYRGYEITWTGSLIGFGWAFVAGLIGGGALALLYNLLLGRKN